MKPVIGFLLLAFFLCRIEAEEKFFERGKYKFYGSRGHEKSGGTEVTIRYLFCHNGTATRIRFPQKKDPSKWDQGFKIRVTKIYKWGFKIKIAADRKRKPRLFRRMILVWKAIFASHLDVNFPCFHAIGCNNNPGLQRCWCTDEYMGSKCNKRKKFCFPNPCQHSGECEEFSDGYQCKCNGVFTGINCTNVLLKDTIHLSNVNVINQTTMVNVAHKYCYSLIPLELNVTLVDSHQFGVHVVNTTLTGFVVSLSKREAAANHSLANISLKWHGFFESRDVWSHRCNFHGNCVNSFDRQRCDCEPQYTGEACEIDLTHCHSQPCQHGGTCSPLKWDYKCLCPEGYGGRSCEYYTRTGSTKVLFSQNYLSAKNNYKKKYINRIFSKCYYNLPLRMKGKVRGLGNYPKDFVVEFIDTDYHWYRARIIRKKTRFTPPRMMLTIDWIAYFRGDPSEDDKICYNNATCINKRSTHACQCKPGFTDIVCSTAIKTCATHSCQNGATCNETETGYTCVCPPDYKGKSCSELTIDAYAKKHGQEILRGFYPVGSNPVFCRNTKKIDVVYDDCYAREASRVSAVVEGDPSWPDKFVVDVESIHIWGFKAIVRRVDDATGWGQDKLELKWKASFDVNILNLKVCKNGGVCRNNRKEQRCHCRGEFSGPTCQTETTTNTLTGTTFSEATSSIFLQ